MVHLIITVIAIALSALVVGVSIQYLPGSRVLTDETAQALRSGIAHLEQGVLAERRASAAAVNTYASPQALTSATFQPYLLIPKAPGGAGSGWSYGTTAALGQAAYVCLNAKAVAEPVYKGLWRVKAASYSDAQMTISTVGCGATADSAQPAFPAPDVYVTYFFKWQG